MRDRLTGREPTESGASQNLPSPFGGAGGLSGERPPLGIMTDAEIEQYAEDCYNRSMKVFEAVMAAYRKPRRRRIYDYTRANCEEARGTKPA